ncbi:protein BCAP isoform X3 [Alligator mississippiensis]|uniref:protein BCAP isoform X3 n=1 Tax=Alligator mississippiensis TaxID=8496 RepID=UPI000906FD9E|nr:protein BCAP isoform X3 [Alligator mississippiensis]
MSAAGGRGAAPPRPGLAQGTRHTQPISPVEAAKLYSMIQSYERDFRTRGVSQHEQYFSDLSEETGSSGNQFSVCLEEEPLRQNWSPHARFMDKHQMTLKEPSLQLESRSQENCLPQNLSEHDMRRLTEEALMQKATVQEKLLEAEMAVSSAEMFLPTFKETVLRITNVSSEHIDILMQKLVETETEIDALKKEVLERQRHIQELSSQLQLQKANALKADHLAKSVEAVQGHLQYQIKRKEMENDQLQTKIQSLEKKITEWKFQIGEHKHQILALKETSEQKNALKKATRVQKQRAERFEAAVENLTSKIKEQEVKLSKILSASRVWKNHHEKAVEEKTVLEIKTETLKKQITNLLEELENIKDRGRISNKEILGKLNSVNSETENIHLENARLKASLAVLENNTVSAKAELLDLQEKAKQQENLVEQYGTQVQKLQMEAEDLKTRYKTALNENKITEAKYLQIDKMENSNSSLRVHSLQEENLNIEKKYEDLKRQLEKMELQNEVLAHQLANQEKSLQHNELQLKEKFTEYGALTRQLEAALEEGRKMVSEEMEKMSSKEQTLQTKILDLETELRERQEEHKQLVCKVNHSQKHHEVCLKELGHRLQKSENQNQSIQNYIKFLKSSYITMFG